MAAFCKRLICILAVAGLIGCAGSSEKSSRWATIPPPARPPASVEPVTTIEPRLTAIPVAPTTSSSLPVAPTNSPPQPNPLPTSDTNAARSLSEWVALEVWSKDLHLGVPQRLWSSTNFTFELRATNGVIALTAGSNLARFNGLACHLGHAPRYGDGQLIVHVRDAEKTIRPLAGLTEGCLPVPSTVVIDPGHGGVNAGTRCLVNDRFEKEFTLDWALRLKPLLESNGWNVVLTRTNDVDVSLGDRVALAEELNAGLFVSLHFNSAFPRQDQSGIETFCLTPTGLPSTLVRDFEDDTTRVFPNNTYDDENLQYAMRVHAALLDGTGAPDRGVRRARFMGVLRGQRRPAILVEGGYLSNPQEAGLIATPEYRQKLAQSVAHALVPVTGRSEENGDAEPAK